MNWSGGQARCICSERGMSMPKSATPQRFNVTDVSGDGSITSLDALMILQAAADAITL